MKGIKRALQTYVSRQRNFNEIFLLPSLLNNFLICLELSTKSKCNLLCDSMLRLLITRVSVTKLMQSDKLFINFMEWNVRNSLYSSSDF